MKVIISADRTCDLPNEVQQKFNVPLIPYHIILEGKDDLDGVTIDLQEMSRKGDGRVRFTLPGGYTLKNTKEGVDIGGFVFEDLFTDFRPLWDSDVIACRDRNYRLVYRYKEKE